MKTFNIYNKKGNKTLALGLSEEKAIAKAKEIGKGAYAAWDFESEDTLPASDNVDAMDEKEYNEYSVESENNYANDSFDPYGKK